MCHYTTGHATACMRQPNMVEVTQVFLQCIANLEELELVTVTGHIETLSIACTMSLVICSQQRNFALFMLHD